MGLLNRIFDRDAGKDKVTGVKAQEHTHELMPDSSMAIDPVCGMEVNKEKAPAVFLYMGRTLYFCSASCQRLFRGNPYEYIKEEGHEMTSHPGGHHSI